MHPRLLLSVITKCKRRAAQGDRPTEPPDSVEILENAVIQLSQMLEDERSTRMNDNPRYRGLPVIGEHIVARRVGD